MSLTARALPHGDRGPRIALVVPVHNVEQYLDECLASVENQSIFEQVQVVLVDDGSTDSSGAIAEAFAARHPNVELVQQGNRGLGGARNRGLDQVRAPFVGFLDSDDRLPERALETLLGIMLEHGADVAIGGMETFPRPTKYAWAGHLDERSKLVAGIEQAEELVHGTSVCNKLFRTDMVRALGLRFGEGVHFEDAFVSLPVLLTADRLALTSEVVYEYRQRTEGGSIMDGLWTRPGNYWDHLALEEYALALRGGLPGPRRPVVDLFLVRSFQGFALRAPQALTGVDLRRFFDRASAVYRSVTPDAISRGCRDADHRVGMLALQLGDWTLFADRGAAVRGVEVHDGRVRLGLGRPLPDLVQALLVADRFTAHVEAVEPDGEDHLRVTGRFSIDGLPVVERPPLQLHVQVGGLRVLSPAVLVTRHVVTANVPGDTWSGFTCRIPVATLDSGDHLLSLVLTTATGELATALRPTPGALAAARTLDLRSCLTVLRAPGRRRTVLQVTRGSDGRARKEWRRRHLVEDLKHVLRRRPLWRQRLVRTLTSAAFRSPVWLLGERRDTAQDNSAVLFEHLRRHRPDVRAYYLIERSSPHHAQLKALGRVLPHGGLRHRLLMLHAAVLVNSYDINAYMLPKGWDRAHYLQHLAWRIGSRRVFLQHGVTYNDVSSALHKSMIGADLVTATSELEAAAMRSTMGYRQEVAVTGFPRYDRLVRGPVGRRVLVMPTWRTFLVKPSYRQDGHAPTDFAASRYAAFWRTLLADPGLLDLLDRTDTTLEFFGHYEIVDVLRDLAPEHPRIVVSHHGTRSVQEAILDCSLFVTDWSSTFFDAAYAGRPVVLTPFDEAEYRAKQYPKGYVDGDDLGFGPVARTVPAALAAIERYVQRDFRREAAFSAAVDSFFAHHDGAHCERVVAAIERVVRGLPPLTESTTPDLGEVALAA